MGDVYTGGEYAEMIRLYFENHNSSRAAAADYFNLHGRNVHHNTVQAAVRRLRETGSTIPRFGMNGGGDAHPIPVRIRNRILDIINARHGTSIRQLSLITGVPHSSVHRILHEDNLHPYHKTSVQELFPADNPRRLFFCQQMLGFWREDNHFFDSILFTDEAVFDKEGIRNLHNDVLWYHENPHAVRVRSYQNRFSITVWCGIIGSIIVGPVILPNRVNGDVYLGFLREVLPLALQDRIEFDQLQHVWLQHDGAPAHFSLQVREHLNQVFPDQWIGRGGPIEWPARSPDLTPLDFFLWGHLKNKMYCTPIAPQTVNELRQRMMDAFDTLTLEMMEKITSEFRRRLWACIMAQGGHFENLPRQIEAMLEVDDDE